MSKLMVPIKLVRTGRGRPPKFGRPAHAVTLTLPDDVIAALTSIDDDLGRAVVRLVQPLVADAVRRPLAELTKYGHSAVIVVKPVAALDRIRGVTMVPLPDGRALISLDESMSVYEFELKLGDAIDDADIDARERAGLSSIAEILREARRARGIVVLQRSIIVLQSTRHRRLNRVSFAST